jgi:plastocyanin
MGVRQKLAAAGRLDLFSTARLFDSIGQSALDVAYCSDHLALRPRGSVCLGGERQQFAAQFGLRVRHQRPGAPQLVVAAQARREFNVSARQYSFEVSGSPNAEIRVTQDDLVHITFHSEDIPHSFTIEEAPYRIMRRVERGKPVSFDFRADQPGRFRFFCSLTTDPKCKEMHGALIVEKK